ncbi:MAG: hypothetical protein JSS65_12950 [Armatimonadetes bacterium]|nr:hypothetical protein [Armatimonadota bacterium]
MEIRDYESGKHLTDVDIVLSREEAEELNAYLQRLLVNPELRSVHLSEVNGVWLERELTFSLQSRPFAS